jgi:periplasmic protein TonB
VRTYKRWALAAVLSTSCSLSASAATPGVWKLNQQKLESNRALTAWETSAHVLKFVEVPRSARPAPCEDARDPEPLTTPDPLIDDPTAEHAKLSVSFIIGTDGLVHSAFVLNSIGDPQDRAALNAVSSWRYRPALCNGIPTETEGRIEFSNRERIFGLE